MPTKTINHHIIISDEEQCMIVNALAFFEQFFQKHSWATSEVVQEWQDVADDTNLSLVDALATKIATSN